MTSATAVSYFATSDGHGFAWSHPGSPVESVVVANDSRGLRALSAMRMEGFMSPEQYTEITSMLRSKSVANDDNPQKSWVQRVSETSRSQLER